MNLHDSAGYPVSGANSQSLESFESAAHEFRCFIRDPVATIEGALAHSSEMVMAHVLRAYLHLLGTEPAGLPVARACHNAAIGLPANERERRHLETVRLLTEGSWHEAGRMLEDLSVIYPRDALALQAGHQIDFFTGDARMLRDRIARALPAWSAGMPGYHALLGMHAFGLEETGDYAGAERKGRTSVELEPRDGWGWHAVAHVMEMTQRPREGIAWLRGNSANWSVESFFAVHNWWHLALYHLELDEIDAVLRLLDDQIYGKCSGVVLNMIDASALLWRLKLRGVDVGNRWDAVADNWVPIATAGNYAFNDMHAMMAFVGSHRPEAQKGVLEAQRATMQGEGDNVAFTAQIGHPAALAIKAFGEGNYAEAVRLLRPNRSHAQRFGGSHAQRDVIDLTLIEAAFRAGDGALAAALAAERVALRPNSPLALRYVERCNAPTQGAARAPGQPDIGAQPAFANSIRLEIV